VTARLLVFAGAVVAAAMARPGPTVSGGPNEKLALVTVAADESRPATALTPADFVITEEKDKLEVIEAVPARDPLSVVVLADTAITADGAASTPEMRKGLKGFVATLLAGEPGAQIALYQVANAAIPVTDFTSSRADLEAGITTIASGTGAGSAMLEGVGTAAKRLGQRPAPRRAIVCVAIGTAEGTSLLPKKVGDAVLQSGATLWVVSLQSAFDASLTSRDTLWTRTTADSGGLRHNIALATRIEPRLQAVANSLLSQYFLRMVRSREGAVKGFKGQTAQGSQILFSRWTR
jgi:hypothetical protein